tara:strand:- start:17 stop:907 length:891 start_codon:yes stop_codon:yes gene_type:complete
MRIAVGFFGQFRTFEKISNNIIQTFDSEHIEFDFYASTWSEGKKDIENILRDNLNFVEIDIEESSEEIEEAIEIFGTIYPMNYKKNKVFEIIKKSKRKYDYVILTRFDLEYLSPFPFDDIEKNVLGTGVGYVDKINETVGSWWRDKNFTFNEEHKLIMETDKASINRSDDYVLNNICDQIYAADIKTISLYLEFFNIIEIYFEKYKKTSRIKKSIEKKLYLIYKTLVKSPRKDNKALKVFKVYKFLSKNLGFYVPFFCSVPVHLTSKFKPTLYSYIIEARNIDTKELNLKYTLNRG